MAHRDGATRRDQLFWRTEGGPMPRRLTLPLAEEQARALEVGDEVLVSGLVLTAQGAALRALAARVDARLRALARGALLFHCAPLVARDGERGPWRCLAARPAHSMRHEPYQAEILARYGFRGVIGVGGMGPATLAALARQGAVYLHAPRGLAVALARRVARVHGPHLADELGPDDALWSIEVEDFPAIVTMDAQGRSLHAASAEAVQGESA
jgi:fumarate hydratase class I